MSGPEEGNEAGPAVLIMARAPRPGRVKTRLHPLLGPDGCAALQRELIRHTARVAASCAAEITGAGRTGAVTVIVAVGPPDAGAELRGLVPGGTRLLRQHGAHLGERLAAATCEAFRAGHGPVVVIGTDIPGLTPGRLAEAFAQLARGRDVVFGPAFDGGYYLVGLTRPAPELFAFDPALWGGEGVLAASLAAARGAALTVALLPPLRDLDTPDDAAALLADPLTPRRIGQALQPGRRTSAPALRAGDLRQSSVSIVIPVLNEAATIVAALRRLRRDFPGCELVVADGGSTDGTAGLAAPLARVIRGEPGRARQMNAGARHASGDVLWFVHADTRIDPAALGQLRSALADRRTAGGGLAIRFDQPGFALRYLAWTSNLRARYLHWVFGDQAMFIRRTVFDELGGFPDLPIMEDLEMSRRLHRHGRIAVLPATSTASARRFAEHGTWRMLVFMQYLKLLYFAGADPQQICDRYRAGPRWQRRQPARARSRSHAHAATDGAPAKGGNYAVQPQRQHQRS